MSVIPFSMDTYLGLGSVQGLIRCEANALILEYRTRDSVMGLLRTRPREVRIPIDQICAIRLDEGFFGTSLEIQTSTLRTWQDFPGSDQGRVRLGIARADRPSARELVAALLPKTPGIDPADDLA
ncbi:hypothetical protein BH23PLA1_BH23PLA1_28970 [soil metagenome]